MRKKLLTLLLAVCITGLYTFGDAAAIFAEEAGGDTGTQVEQNVDSTSGGSGDQVDSSTQSGKDKTSGTTEESNKDQTEESKDAATTEQPTTDEQTTTDENKDATNETKEVSYPAKTFEDTIDGTKVTVDAPEGAFPEGTTMELSKVDNNDVKDLVEKAAGTEVSSMLIILMVQQRRLRKHQFQIMVKLKFPITYSERLMGMCLLAGQYHLIIQANLISQVTLFM